MDQSGKNLLQNRDNHAYATFTAPAAGTYTFYSVVSEYMEFQNVYDENWVPLDEKDYSRPYVLNNNAGVQLSMTEGQTVNFKLYLSGRLHRSRRAQLWGHRDGGTHLQGVWLRRAHLQRMRI